MIVQHTLNAQVNAEILNRDRGGGVTGRGQYQQDCKIFVRTFSDCYGIVLTSLDCPDSLGHEISQILVKKYIKGLLSSELHESTSYLSWVTWLKSLEEDKTTQVRLELAETQDLLVKDFELLVQREGKLEDLMARTERLSSESIQFTRQNIANKSSKRHCCTIL